MLPTIGHGHMMRIRLQRPGSLREAGDVFAFLASEQASYLTEQCIMINGAEDR
jgi:hypothetical protein